MPPIRPSTTARGNRWRVLREVIKVRGGQRRAGPHPHHPAWPAGLGHPRRPRRRVRAPLDGPRPRGRHGRELHEDRSGQELGRVRRRVSPDSRLPMQNFVYADIDGNIGYYGPGAIPVRGGGSDGRDAGAGLDRRLRVAGIRARERVAQGLQPRARIHCLGQQQGGAGFLPVPAWAPAGSPPIASRESPSSSRRRHAWRSTTWHASSATCARRRSRSCCRSCFEPARGIREAATRWRASRSGTERIAAESPDAALYEAWYTATVHRLFSDELGEDLCDRVRTAPQPGRQGPRSRDPVPRRRVVRRRADQGAGKLRDDSRRLAGDRPRR